MSGPGIATGQTIAAPVSHVDLYPTILEAAKIESSIAEQGLTAKSLWPVLNGEKDECGSLFAEYHGTATRSGGYVLRNGPYKLILFVDMPPQLFDLEADPEEAKNLAEEQDYRETLDLMLSRLLQEVDPDKVDRAAKNAQAALIETHGGKNAVLQKMGGFSYSPPPGVRWQDMEGNQG